MSEREFFLGHPVNFRFPLFHRLISCYLLESMYLTMISLKCTSVQLSQLKMLWGLLVLAPCLVDTCGDIWKIKRFLTEILRNTNINVRVQE